MIARTALLLLLACSAKLSYATEVSTDADPAIARILAEINRRIADENKRPYRTFITPNTKTPGYAEYYQSVRQRLEEFGTRHFPAKNGHKLYGNLIIHIPVYQDGKIFKGEGGVKIERSSGNPDLDEAAREIVLRAAPFSPFPVHMLSRHKDDMWVIVSCFDFTREPATQTDLAVPE
jgi:protein TonB